MDPLLSAVLLATVSGYGDVDTGGHPSWAERDMHLWTNAVRVDPEAFADEYALGGCSLSGFSSDERAPKAPLYYNRDLNTVARLHSEDMRDNDFFSHSSSDGTSFSARVGAWYATSAIGENIAWGYADSAAVVLQGWMCSTEGHRQNIMSGDWTELGTGAASDFYTQDFGGGAVVAPGPVAMGSHTPQQPADALTFLADWLDDAPPATLEVVLDGQATPLQLTYGIDTQGVYTADVAWDGGACAAYFFRWTDATGSEGTFPGEGSYLIGAGCDEPLMWEDSQHRDSPLSESWDDDDDDEGKGGCSAAGGPAALGALLGLAALVGRRRRAGSGEDWGVQGSQSRGETL